ncbi:helicase-exonuclease AddAB subunit AddA [Candidatus Sumerlaeota bacterium]|nr:helicase-exonuclease AddAB subunit AddA [Candidatus Sumerlaeota bacterium]
MPQWTPSQRLAIDTIGCDLLVSASAGTGKTAVLVERIVRLVLDGETPVDIDRFLVVTFTRAAASEMRERIASALRERLAARPRDERLRRQALLLDRAQISTIHSFCETLLRQHFHRLGIDPEFSIADAQEAALLETEVARRLFEREFERQDPIFLSWLDSFHGANPETRARQSVLRIHRFLQSVEDPETWERAVREAYPVDETGRKGIKIPFEDYAWFAAWRESFVSELDYFARELDECRRAAHAIEPKYEGWIESVSEAVASARTQAGNGNWDGAIRSIRDFKPRSKPGIRNKSPECERLKERLDNLQEKSLKGVLQSDLAAATPAEAARTHAAVAPTVHLLLDLARRFRDEYAEVKRASATLDFADLERLSLALLRHDDVARVCRERFDHVLVDEYQDINPVQDAILRLVSRGGERGGSSGNLFAVGDVKQSIYAFRLAAPEIFLEKYERFASLSSESRGGAGSRVDLRENFRSRPGVLSGVNEVFRRLMNRESCGMDYGAGAELVAGAAYPPAKDSRDPIPVEVHLLESDASEARDEPGVVDEDPESEGAADWSAIENEALWIGRRIRAMVGDPERGIPSEFEVWDSQGADASQSPGRATRPVGYGDIAILMRSVRGRAESFVSVLSSMGIPVHAELESGFFEAAEVRDVLHLLRLIDNPLQDIPLAAVLRSPIEGWSDADLMRIRGLCPTGPFSEAFRLAGDGAETSEGVRGRAADFLRRLDRWRTRARRGELADLVASIYDETGYPACVLAMEGGAVRHANLARLHRLAGRFDRFLRQGLGRFLRFVEQLREEEHDYGEASPSAESRNAVRIMTVHKSKGLEFPVVFLADTARKFNLRDASESIVLDRHDGVGVVVTDSARSVSYPSPSLRLLRRGAVRRMLAEEMRVLYVAMTRARERLVLSASFRKIEDRLRRWIETDAGEARRVLDARNAIDWIGPILARDPDAGRVLSEAVGSAPRGRKSAPSSGAKRFALHVHRADAIARWRASAAEEKTGPVGGTRADDFVCVQEDTSDEQVAAAVDRIEWSYPHAILASHPSRISTSEAKHRLDTGSEEGERATALPGVQSPGFSLPSSLNRLDSPDAADAARERGRVTHLVLQHLDLRGELDYAGVSAQMDRMIERGLIDETGRGRVDIPRLADFFAGPLGRRVLEAGPGRVWREVPFILGLTPSELGMTDLEAYDAEERIRVQGVIDCLVEEADGLVLIDYKTDRVPAEAGVGRTIDERAAAHAPQVRLYARAVDAIFRQPLKEAHLYFLSVGESVEVRVSDAKTQESP